MKVFFIYLVTNTVNGKIYVGKTSDVSGRWTDHCALARSGGRRLLCSAIRKYGAESFAVTTLVTCRTEEDAFFMERACIADLRSNDKRVGYNMTAGGEGASGYRHTPESLKKMGDVHRGQQWTEAQRARMSEALRGRIFTPETRAKITAAKLGHQVSAETRAKLAAANLGKRHSAEARAKVGAASRGRPRRRWTDEEKAAMSKKLSGRKLSEEHKAKIGQALRRYHGREEA